MLRHEQPEQCLNDEEKRKHSREFFCCSVCKRCEKCGTLNSDKSSALETCDTCGKNICEKCRALCELCDAKFCNDVCRRLVCAAPHCNCENETLCCVCVDSYEGCFVCGTNIDVKCGSRCVKCSAKVCWDCKKERDYDYFDYGGDEEDEEVVCKVCTGERRRYVQKSGRRYGSGEEGGCHIM